MSNFVNLLDIIYPVHSIYITNSTVSPATSIGGTWTQITDGACLAAYTNTSGYTGSKHITVDQMPAHSHSATNKHYGNNVDSNWPYQWGGGGIDNSDVFVQKITSVEGKGHDYYPYSYACKVWVRTA